MNNKNNPPFPILIVDDEEAILLSIDTTLRMAGFDNIITCSDSRAAVKIFSEKEMEIILLDLTMPHVSGHELLEIITKDYPGIPVIIITGAIDVDTAVKCMKSGAFDYIVKPVEHDRLISSVKRALEFRELKRENSALKRRILSSNPERPEIFSNIITANKKMLAIFRYIESIAGTSQGILILGETGTGKELIAGAIHRASGVKGKFVPVNVAGLDDNVFSDTLFGHVKGAFTGADNNRKGMIEQARGGTLFLDEIGDLSPASQVKLLRLLQEGEYLPLGADEHKKANVRIVASTHRDLWDLGKKGKFRKDLHYRLRTHRIHIPPLRERTDDIPLLITHFLGKAAKSLGKKKPTPPKELFTLLETYSFPGNVRELEAMIYDAVSIHKSGILSLKSFKYHIRAFAKRHRDHKAYDDTTPGKNINKIIFPENLPTIKEASSLLVAEAMKRAKGNQSVAATLLGISQQALSKRLKKEAEKNREISCMP